MNKHKEIFFEGDDRSIIISDSLGDVKLNFSFTQERLIMTQEELREFINVLKEYEVKEHAKN